MNQTTTCTPPTPLRERFERTVCACKACSRHCHHMPGCLGTGDLARIAEHLKKVPAEIMHMFRASPGALVSRSGLQFRIGTIVPAKNETTGACVFLDDAGKCQIHDVAPWGCAYFDDHMDPAEANLRSALMLEEIAHSELYKLERIMVARVGGKTVAPERLRAEYDGR